MKNEDVFKYLFNYTNFATKVIPNNGYPIPNFEMALREIKKDNQLSEHYYKRIREINETKKIPERMDIVRNIDVDFSWLIIGVNDLLKEVQSIPTQIDNNIEKYRKVSVEKNTDISIEIDNMIKIKNNFIDSELFSQTLEKIQNKLKTIEKYRVLYNKAIEPINIDKFKEPEKALELYQIGGGEVKLKNNNINESPYLKDIKILFEKMDSEGMFENKQIIDLNPLKKEFDKLNEANFSIYNKLRENGIAFTDAQYYLDKTKKSKDSLTGFLEAKKAIMQDDDILKIIKNTNGKYIDEIYICPDQSILIKNKKNELSDILSNDDVTKLNLMLIKEAINEEFPKNPHLAKTIFSIMPLENTYKFYLFANVVNTLKENLPILKLYNFDILKSFKEKEMSGNKKVVEKCYELLDDEMNKIVRTHTIKNYAEGIVSNKYRHLYNEDTYKIMENLYDIKVTEKQLQNYIGKKIAAYKTSDEFNSALSYFAKSFNEFTVEATLLKANNVDATVISNEDNIVILQVHTHEQCKTMGSAAWCIARDESYFKSYTDGCDQYIIFDFNKDSKDNDSMIGVTVDSDGEISAAHYKDDDEIDFDDEDLNCYVDMIYENKKLEIKTKLDTKKLVI